MKTNAFLLLALAAFAGAADLNAHEHLAAGATAPTNGAPLVFFNAGDYAAPSGYVFNLSPGDPGGPYEGYYETGDLVFVALAATPDLGGPETGHAALGCHIQVVLESISGPATTFGFWEAAAPDVDGTNITWTVPVPLLNGTNRIDVSENDGLPGSDPYGHLHGRQYSVTTPGLYTAGFQFVDNSTNGPGGGPIHTPSDVFYLYLQAGVTIANISVDDNGVNLTFGAPSNLPDTGTAPATNYTIETSPVLGPSAVWTPVGDVVVGDDHLHTVTVPLAGAAAFYRLETD